jgi:EmrB/QacA subfamily drug resistance transporter
MESMDTTILNTAVPIIAQAMHVPPLNMKCVLASYTLSLAIFIPISGWMADRFGTRRVFAYAIGLFTLASLLCGLSHNIYQLVACRILQGVGGAMMVPVGRLTIVRAYSRSDLVRVLSFVTIFGWIGPVLGPVLGGAIVSHLAWGFIFFVNIPIGLLGLNLILRHLPDYRQERKGPLDIVGWTLFGAGIALLSYVLEIFGEHFMSQGTVIALLAVALALITAYVFHSIRTPFPLLNTRLFRIRTFSAAVAGSFVTRIGVGGVPFLLPLLYQLSLGYTPIKSGLLIVPQAISGILAKLALPSVLHRLGYRRLLIGNTITMALLIMLFSTVDPDTPIWAIVLLAFCYGACSSLQYTTMNTMAYADVDEKNLSGAGSIASTAQELSISFGIASAGLIAAIFVPRVFLSNISEVMEFSLGNAFLVLGGLTLLSTLVFSRLRANDGHV